MAKMTDSERVALHRKRKLWEELKRDGWTSPKELQDEVRGAGVPWTWNSRRKPLPGHVGVEDLLPSRKVVDKLRKRRRPSGGGTGSK